MSSDKEKNWDDYWRDMAQKSGTYAFCVDLYCLFIISIILKYHIINPANNYRQILTFAV